MKATRLLMGLQFGQKKQPAHFKTKVQAAFAFLGRPKQPKGYLKTISKQPATHLAQTVRSNLRPAAFGLPHHKRHATHAELSGEVCAVGNALLGLRFGGRGWSGFPLPACSRFVAIRRPTRPILPCPSRLKSGMGVMGQRQHRRHAHRLAESKNQTDGSLHCFRQPKM